MTDIVKRERNFMGITIRGDYNSGRSYYDQLPLEDLYPYFQNAFEQGVKAISWRQYTPYFNDGEPCEFGFSDISFTSNPVVAKAWLQEEYGDEDDRYDPEGNIIEEIVPTDFYSYEEPWSERYPHPDGFKKGDVEFPDFSQFERVLCEKFGDHTTVVVSPNYVVQYEYHHD